MVWQLNIQTVAPEQRQLYADAVRAAIKEADFSGFIRAQILNCVEHPGRVIVMVEWESIEAHKVHHGTPAHARVREALKPFLTGGGDSSHYNIEPF